MERSMKHEYKIHMLSLFDINHSAIEKLEDDGWELCGHISSPAKDGCSSKTTRVPMRRERCEENSSLKSEDEILAAVLGLLDSDKKYCVEIDDTTAFGVSNHNHNRHRVFINGLSHGEALVLKNIMEKAINK